MGISIGHCKHTIDMGYGGFFKLRRKIAELLNEDFGKLYNDWVYPPFYAHMSDEEGNARLKKLYDNGKLTDDDDVVVEFLFASDTEGELSVQGCKRLYDIIKDYDDNVCYGYCGRPDCAMFKDFKEIIHDCVKYRRKLWYN